MARRTIIEVTDDLDGETIGAEPVLFGFGRDMYEIDLTADHAEALAKALAPYIDHGRRISRWSAQGLSGRERGRADRLETAAIRNWARDTGLKVSDRGRIPVAVVEQYEAAKAKQNKRKGAG